LPRVASTTPVPAAPPTALPTAAPLAALCEPADQRACASGNADGRHVPLLGRGRLAHDARRLDAIAVVVHGHRREAERDGARPFTRADCRAWVTKPRTGVPAGSPSIPSTNTARRRCARTGLRSGWCRTRRSCRVPAGAHPRGQRDVPHHSLERARAGSGRGNGDGANEQRRARDCSNRHGDPPGGRATKVRAVRRKLLGTRC
jgi:hypothetical protein